MKGSRNPYLTLKDWVGIFQEAARQGGRVLPIASLRQVTRLSEGALRKALQRLEKRALVFRLGPGLYASRLFPPTLEAISMAVGRPCYISFESALSRYGVLSQSPMLLACATQRKPRSLRTAAGEISLRHIARERFWGFREEQGVLWAEPEKALLDWLYWKLKREGRSPDADELIVEDLDKEKLRRWALRYPRSVQKALSELSA